jgi:hypothetical protein
MFHCLLFFIAALYHLQALCGISYAETVYD